MSDCQHTYVFLRQEEHATERNSGPHIEVWDVFFCSSCVAYYCTAPEIYPDHERISGLQEDNFTKLIRAKEDRQETAQRAIVGTTEILCNALIDGAPDLESITNQTDSLLKDLLGIGMSYDDLERLFKVRLAAKERLKEQPCPA